MSLRYRSISPLIATILLIVVSVIIVTIVLTWGKSYVNDSFNETKTFTNQTNVENLKFIKFKNGINGRFFFDYYPPNNTDLNFTVVSYSYNDYPLVPLEPEKTISSLGTFYLDLGIVDTGPFMINLVLSNGTYLSFENITSVNRSPSPNDCPEGYIPVPGNYLYDTVGSKGGFCVPKYEMKIDRNGDGVGNLASDYGCEFGTFNVWQYTLPNCSNGSPVSTATGSPVIFGGLSQARSVCESLGENYHLMTNDEWMTLARNIEIIPNNWYNPDTETWGTSPIDIGNGNKLPQGQKTTNPNACLDASQDDDDGFFGINNVNNSHRRTFYLTNGEIIWDLSGNLFEFVDVVIAKKDLPDLFNADGTEYNNINMLAGDYAIDGSEKFAKWNDLGNTTLTFKDLYLLTGNYYTRNNGNVGYLYTLSNRSSTDETLVVFIRGGHWADTIDCGLLTLLTNRTFAGTDPAGARCVYYP